MVMSTKKTSIYKIIQIYLCWTCYRVEKYAPTPVP